MSRIIFVVTNFRHRTPCAVDSGTHYTGSAASKMRPPSMLIASLASSEQPIITTPRLRRLPCRRMCRTLRVLSLHYHLRTPVWTALIWSLRTLTVIATHALLSAVVKRFPKNQWSRLFPCLRLWIVPASICERGVHYVLGVSFRGNMVLGMPHISPNALNNLRFLTVL